LTQPPEQIITIFNSAKLKKLSFDVADDDLKTINQCLFDQSKADGDLPILKE
jgi:hypothetical protein